MRARGAWRASSGWTATRLVRNMATPARNLRDDGRVTHALPIAGSPMPFRSSLLAAALALVVVAPARANTVASVQALIDARAPTALAAAEALAKADARNAQAW